MKDLIAALVCLLVSGCATPTHSAAPPAAAAPTPPAPATASPATAVSVDVRFAGTIHCASFPYGCTATLSVLEPGVVVTSAWRPPPSDPGGLQTGAKDPRQITSRRPRSSGRSRT